MYRLLATTFGNIAINNVSDMNICDLLDSNCGTELFHGHRHVLLLFPPTTLSQTRVFCHWRIQGGGAPGTHPLLESNSFIFMQLSAKSLQNNPTLGVGAPLLMKILHPPLFVQEAGTFWSKNLQLDNLVVRCQQIFGPTVLFTKQNRSRLQLAEFPWNGKNHLSYEWKNGP